MKNVGYIHRKANIIDVSMIRTVLDQTAKYHAKLPEDVNYIQTFALSNLLQHGTQSGAERLLVKRNISIEKSR